MLTLISKYPNKMVKQITVLGETEIVHIYDFEEIQNEQSFKNTLSNMKSAANMKKNVTYKLGYTNFSFDLWIILHKECLRGKRTHRSNYLTDLNRCFKTHFESMLEYKEENNFKKLVNSLTLDDVVNAIRNAEKIERQNLKDYQQIQHCGYEYFRENPSLSIHKHIKDILETLNLL